MFSFDSNEKWSSLFLYFPNIVGCSYISTYFYHRNGTFKEIQRNICYNRRDSSQAYQLVSPKPQARPFVLKYIKLLGFANQASISLGCSCSLIINFLNLTFKQEVISLIIFLTKIIKIGTLNMKIGWVFIQIWIIFKLCGSLWHVNFNTNFINHPWKCIFQALS